MKQLITITVFVLASTLGFAQYNHVRYSPAGTIVEQGQYNADPGITANDSKETIGQKMSQVHKIGTWQYWNDNGTKLAEEHYTNAGTPTGFWKSWSSATQLSSEINYTTGDAVYYHQNGAKAEAGKINMANERIGDWKGWHENGKKNYTGSWSSTGQKNGTWQFYDNTEQLIGTEQWNNGVLAN
ncbi:MAG: hypothetical protein NT084_08745 [Bacteroidetes bacterium]|jgi:antitoxin component YwqK of YwqJK toxin-antitoxin module|nr:hypothetical protein [Bacteroidota bacterium]